jgi:pyruvate/2-oxoglutarate dehydrogenase complex dihydrolipoamide acyltransferase (E2) component
LSETGEGSRKIKVVDRRRFDETGDLRPDRPKPEKREPAAAPPEPAKEDSTAPKTPPPAAAGAPQTQEPSSAQTTSPLFMELVAGLAQQAEVLLTGGHGITAQPEEAQRVIEYLATLEVKTAGNLSAEEKQVLSGVIFQLRSMFVQHNA